MSATPRFTWSDAWLLHAVAAAGGAAEGASLVDILCVGDAMNHAAFTTAELRRGFAKLTAAGLVTESDERFRLAGEASEAWKRAESLESVVSQRKELERLLTPDPYPAGAPGFEDPDWPYPLLSEARIANAEAQYQQRMKAAWRTVMKGKR